MIQDQVVFIHSTRSYGI